jgi:hypothetical protein
MEFMIDEAFAGKLQQSLDLSCYITKFGNKLTWKLNQMDPKQNMQIGVESRAAACGEDAIFYGSY